MPQHLAFSWRMEVPYLRGWAVAALPFPTSLLLRVEMWSPLACSAWGRQLTPLHAPSLFLCCAAVVGSFALYWARLMSVPTFIWAGIYNSRRWCPPIARPRHETSKLGELLPAQVPPSGNVLQGETPREGRCRGGRTERAALNGGQTPSGFLVGHQRVSLFHNLCPNTQPNLTLRSHRNNSPLCFQSKANGLWDTTWSFPSCTWVRL